MEVSKSFRRSSQDEQGNYDTVEFSIALTHQDVGLEAPTDIQSARRITAELSKEAEALCLIEKVKRGLIRPEQLANSLRPWVLTVQTPQNSKSSSTAQV